MLDDRDRRILADLERDLDDGRFRGRAVGHFLLGHPWWPLVCVVLVLAVAVFLVTLGMVGNAALLLAVAAAPMTTRVVRHLARPRGPGPDRTV